jgi:peroxidase
MAFVEGMVKMGEVQNPRKGEIRRNCRVSNGSPRGVVADHVLDF